MTEDAGLSSRKSSHFGQLSAEPRKYTPMLIKCRYGANKCHYSRDSWVFPAVRCRSSVRCFLRCSFVPVWVLQEMPRQIQTGNAQARVIVRIWVLPVQPESPGASLAYAYRGQFSFSCGLQIWKSAGQIRCHLPVRAS